MKESDIEKVTYQIFKALAYMQKRSIPHGDIHSGDILLKGNHVKVSDFGTAASLLLHRARSDEKPHPELLGTFPSPEVNAFRLL